MVRLITFMVIVFLAASAFGQMEPTDFKQWEDSANSAIRGLLLGGNIKNYPSGENWLEIESDWITLDDTLHTNRRAALQTDVTDAGQATVSLTLGGATYTVSQRLLKVIWINTSTKNWVDIADVTWNTPSVDTNVIKWQGIIPDVDYRIVKNGGRVEHGIYFKPAFLDSAVTLYNQRADSSDIALGNVMAYTLTGVDNADSALGTLDKRDLKKIGKWLFSLNKQNLQFPDIDTTELIPVKQRWVKQSGKIYCVEYVMMHDIKRIHELYPTEMLWHNASIVLDESAPLLHDESIGGGYARPPDSYLWSRMMGWDSGETDSTFGVYRFDLSDIAGGSTIDSIHSFFWTTAQSDLDIEGESLRVYPLNTTWVDSQVTWDSIDNAGNGWSGGTDFTPADYETTPTQFSVHPDTLASSGSRQEMHMYDGAADDGLVDIFQGVLDGTYEGMMMSLTGTGGTTDLLALYHTEYSNATYRPQIYVEYTAGGGGGGWQGQVIGYKTNRRYYETYFRNVYGGLAVFVVRTGNERSDPSGHYPFVDSDR